MLDELSERGLPAVCGAVEIEVIHSARTVRNAQRARWLLGGFDWLPMPDEVWGRAIEIQVQALRQPPCLVHG